MGSTHARDIKSVLKTADLTLLLDDLRRNENTKNTTK